MAERSPTGRMPAPIEFKAGGSISGARLRRERRELFGDWVAHAPREVTMGQIERYLRSVRHDGGRDHVLEAMIMAQLAEVPRSPLLPGRRRGPMTDVEMATELLTTLLHCPSCGKQLSEPVCAPVHALLQDSPLQHPILLPLMELAVKKIRTENGRICGRCPGRIPIATGDCPHVVNEFGRVWISTVEWDRLAAMIKDAAAHLEELNQLHEDFVDSVADERKRAEDDRQRWAAEWALEKFSRLCADPHWATQTGSLGFQVKFEQMLTEDT